jgi:uncharacterized protein
VIVLDVNVLLYAYDSSSAKHTKAREWLERTLSEEASIGIPWQTVSAFLRIVTNHSLPGQRYSIEEAIHIVDEWVAHPHVRLLAPGEDHWSSFRHALLSGQARGAIVTDAQLAALAVEHGGTLCSTDRDFARFPALRWKNPLD